MGRRAVVIVLALSGALLGLFSSTAQAYKPYTYPHPLTQKGDAAISANTNGAIIVDHRCTDLSLIPDSAIADAAKIRSVMRHASVLGYLARGLYRLRAEDSKYDNRNFRFKGRGHPGAEPVIDDFLLDDLTSKEPGGFIEHHYKEHDVFSTYLYLHERWKSGRMDWTYYRDAMNACEAKYPDKKIIWCTMTIRANYSSGGAIEASTEFNSKIRDYCRKNGKILYDIADIMCHDPEGNKTTKNGCEYFYPGYVGGSKYNTVHVESPLGQKQLAGAYWWLHARMAGWEMKSSVATKDPEKVFEEFDRIKKSGNISARDFASVADAYAQTGRFEEALGYYDKSLGMELVLDVRVKKVMTEMRIKNPNHKGKRTYNLIDGKKVGMRFNGKGIGNIAALKELPIGSLGLSGSSVSDIKTLKGMPLTSLRLDGTQIRDISTLKGMPLTTLFLNNTKISDISALKNMPLTFLDVTQCEVTDISVLKNSSKLSALAVTPIMLGSGWKEVVRGMKSLKILATNAAEVKSRQTPEQFWKNYEAGKYGVKPTPGTKQPALDKVWIIPGVGLGMLPVRAGTFLMGSPETEKGRLAYGASRQENQHRVTITKPFLMGKYEVTQEEYTKIMGDNPSRFKGDRLPVETVTWNNAMDFCRRLTARERVAGRLSVDMEYRLPTEAEWEYACRAGTETAHYGKELGALAWFNGNSGKKTHPVGEKKPNSWGLYDMHGNVWEWCLDRCVKDLSNGWSMSTGTYKNGIADPQGAKGYSRVIRGGSWRDGSPNCRSACRFGNEPFGLGNYDGFRLVLAFSPVE